MAMDDPIIVADIGGTNARFALARYEKKTITISDAQRFHAEDFGSIRDAAAAYMESVSIRPVTGCFAVAGPVTDEQVEFTNSPWVLNIAEVKSALSMKQFLVVNDFEALASGVQSLKESDLLTVKPGVADPNAPVLVLGPGTGLGQALIVPFGGKRKIISTEGGHVSFAPRTNEEIAVMQFIMREHPRVSVERLLSGRGLVNLHRALCSLTNTQRVSLQADEITAAALDGTYPIAARAVNMFCELLGRVASDAVLGTGARGGVVLGGGILPKIRELFLKSAFVERFLDKGRMRYYVADVPVQIIVTDGAALLGAAAMAKDKFDTN
jgi:glucokinase